MPASGDLKLLGFWRQPDATRWKPFSEDQESVTLNAPIDDVVFGETREDCLAQIHAKYPASDPNMSLVEYRWQTHPRHQSISGDPSTNWDKDDSIDVSETERYCGADPWEALALAKKLGTIETRNLTTEGYCYDGPKWEEEGCIVTSVGWYTGIKKIKYDPKGLLRAKKAAATRQKTGAVLVSDVASAIWQLAMQLNDVVRIRGVGSDWNSRYSCCICALETIKWFNAVFGKNAHRRNKHFRELKKKWKERAEASRKAWYRDAQVEYNDNDPRAVFANFMAEEIKVRNSPVLTEKEWRKRGERWKPPPGTFKAFGHKAYAKQRARDEKAQAKKEAEAKKAAAKKKAKVGGKKGKGNAKAKRPTKKKAPAKKRPSRRKSKAAR